MLPYFKAFEAVLPKTSIYHLDVGTGAGFRFGEIVKSEYRLCNDINPTLDRVAVPCFFGNALDLSAFLPQKLFDLVTCFDMIEHIKKDDGFKLIAHLEGLCKGRLVFFTPLGEMSIGEDKRQYHTHLCGWKPEEFVSLGYSCLVMPNFHDKYGFGAFFAVKADREIEKNPIESTDNIFSGSHWLSPITSDRLDYL